MPVPQTYELWYAYYSAFIPEVIRAIDVLLSKKQKVTDEHCAEIFQKYLSEGVQNEKIRQAGDQIQEAILGVSHRVSDVKSATHKYNEILQGATDRLADKASVDEIRATLRDVLDNTGDMIRQNQMLELELERSTLIMQELQRDLEIVRQQALTDGLTSLSNRKAFDAEIMRLAADSSQTGEPFCLVFMDIDHFKNFNDNFGHQVGDQVLRLVARAFLDGVKGRDLAARYGGEEFALVLPQTSLAGGIKVADSLRVIIQGKELVNRNTGEKLGRITMSGGVAEYVPHESVENLIDRADSALYTAKHNGRNQIASALAPGQSRIKKEEDV